MLTQFFDDGERALIASYLQAWRDLKGIRKETNEDGDLISPKGELVSQIVAELLDTFPERDLEKFPMGHRVWKQKDRDLLHERVRQLFYNLDRRSGTKGSGGLAAKPSRYVSMITLFKKQYGEAIIKRRTQIIETNPKMDPMKAYNTAVNQVLDDTKARTPEAIENLEDLAAQMKSHLRNSPDEQPEEVRQAIMDLFPEELIASVKAWERRTNARIYIMAAWRDSDEQGPKLFDFASSNCGKFIKSEIAKDLKKKWLKWLTANIGADLTMKVQDLKPCIYPDLNGYPMFPRLDRYSLSMDEERLLLRRFFTLSSIAAGGIQPSYVRIAPIMESQPGLLVETRRLPPQSPVIKDLKHWKRLDIDAWIRFLIDGQTGRLPPDRRFFWRVVPRHPDEPELVVTNYHAVPVESARIPWTSAERLYGEQMRLQTTALDFKQPGLDQLPLARTTHIYAPYDMRIFTTLRTMHHNNPIFWEVITLAAQMERFGPIHIEVDLCTLGSANNAHISHKAGILTRDVVNRPDWLPEAFFNSEHPDHLKWSINTLHAWLKEDHGIINKPTGTVYCGPLGIRTVIFALSRIVVNLRGLDRIQAPAMTSRPSYTQTNYNIDIEAATQELSDLIVWLHATLKDSITNLQDSYEQRALLWEDRILALEHVVNAPEHLTESDSGVRATSNIPRSIITIRSMINELKARRTEEAEALEVLDNSRLADEQTVVIDALQPDTNEEVEDIQQTLEERIHITENEESLAEDNGVTNITVVEPEDPEPTYTPGDKMHTTELHDATPLPAPSSKEASGKSVRTRAGKRSRARGRGTPAGRKDTVAVLDNDQGNNGKQPEGSTLTMRTRSKK